MNRGSLLLESGMLFIVQFSPRSIFIHVQTVYFFSLLLKYARRTLYLYYSVDNNDVWMNDLMSAL
mgnify:CR=1 FL=1